MESVLASLPTSETAKIIWHTRKERKCLESKQIWDVWKQNNEQSAKARQKITLNIQKQISGRVQNYNLDLKDKECCLQISYI